MENAEPALAAIPWLIVAGGAYLIVTAWLLGRLVVGLVAVERLRKGAGRWKVGYGRRLWNTGGGGWAERAGETGVDRSHERAGGAGVAEAGDPRAGRAGQGGGPDRG